MYLLDLKPLLAVHIATRDGLATLYFWRCRVRHLHVRHVVGASSVDRSQAWFSDKLCESASLPFEDGRSRLRLFPFVEGVQRVGSVPVSVPVHTTASVGTSESKCPAKLDVVHWSEALGRLSKALPRQQEGIPIQCGLPSLSALSCCGSDQPRE